MGLNLELLKQLQNRIATEMRFRGMSEYAEDACQEYVVRILEGSAQKQPIEYFCTDYLRRYHKKRVKHNYSFVDLPISLLESIHSIDSRVRVENEIDYRIIMEKIQYLRHARQRRILSFYFFSGLNCVDISKRENIHSSQVWRHLMRGLQELRKLIL